MQQDCNRKLFVNQSKNGIVDKNKKERHVRLERRGRRLARFMKSIFVVVSKTQTKFGKVIRTVAKQNYNHAAISLDKEFTKLYAFARPSHHSVLLARLVQENAFRYTLGKNKYVPVAVFEVPVSDEEYEWIKSTIAKISRDSHYIYNYMSIVTYPLLRGIKQRKAFTCVEFVAYLLQHVGYLKTKGRQKWKPDELYEELAEYMIYEGDIRDFVEVNGAYKAEYFKPMTPKLIAESAGVICLVAFRFLFGEFFL